MALETKVGSVQDDVKELKALMTSLITKIDTFSLALTKVGTLEEKVARLEGELEGVKTRNGFKNTLLWVGLVASAIINIVVIYQLFTGGHS